MGDIRLSRVPTENDELLCALKAEYQLRQCKES